VASGLGGEGPVNRVRHPFEAWADGLRASFADEGFGPPMFLLLRRGAVPEPGEPRRRGAPGRGWADQDTDGAGWIAVHAEPVNDSGAVAVTIDSASGGVLLPAVASWFGITPREQAVVRHALAGSPAKRIARELDVSLYTVNDHLKAVYRRTGLAGREELAAGLSR
jgi:DNA-binding CsgD family transcriptional regulator